MGDLNVDGRLVVQLNDIDGNTKSTKLLSSAVVSIRPDDEGSSTKQNIVIYNGPGVMSECVMMTLRSFLDICDPHKYTIKTIGPDHLCVGSWRKTCAAIVFPGGADQQYNHELQGDGNRHIREFVQLDGGCYIGFCAGAYYGSARVRFDIEGPLEVDEEREL